jgi:hypothetical protein
VRIDTDAPAGAAGRARRHQEEKSTGGEEQGEVSEVFLLFSCRPSFISRTGAKKSLQLRRKKNKKPRRNKSFLMFLRQVVLVAALALHLCDVQHIVSLYPMH